jgi:hypothetical protein
MEIDIHNLHHAYLVLGNKSDTDDFIGSLFDKLSIEVLGNPDIFFWKEDRFGIDEARELKPRSESRAFGERKIFVITSQFLTPEAQNALLKVFEEPGENNHFFILAKRNNLLPTLLSRLFVLDLQSKETTSKEAVKFLQSSVTDRLIFAKSKLEDEGFILSDFLEELISALRKNNKISKDIKEIFELSRFASDPAVNRRLILEHLALTLPNSIE